MCQNVPKPKFNNNAVKCDICEIPMKNSECQLMSKNWQAKECDTCTFALLWIHNTVNYMGVKLTNVDMFKFQNFQIK